VTCKSPLSGNFLSVVSIRKCVPEWQGKFCKPTSESSCMCTMKYRCKHAEVCCDE
jgi:hypothetical protein